MDPRTFDRLTAMVNSRRGLLGAGIVALGLAGLSGLEQEHGADASKRAKQRHRKRKQRQRRRAIARNPPGTGYCTDCPSQPNPPRLPQLGDQPCTVCENLSDFPTCAFTSIQTALGEFDGPGDLFLCAGTFKEKITLNFPINIVGAGATRTIIDAGGSGSVVTTGKAFYSLNFLTITGGKATAGGGISTRGQLTLKDIIITGNQSNGPGGGIYNNGGTITTETTTISNNVADNSQGGGIFNSGGTINLQGLTTVRNNTAGDGGGIYSTGNGAVSIDSSSSVTGNSPNNCVGTTVCGA